MPTIAELIRAHMDARGASYPDLARRTGNAITHQALHKLVTEPRKAFPDPKTVEVLSELLDLPVATIVLACARSLGLEVRQAGTALDVVLPPGTEALTAEDREAIRVITRALIDARREAVHLATGSGKTASVLARATASAGAEEAHPADDLTRRRPPDLDRVAARRGESEGRRLRREQDERAP